MGSGRKPIKNHRFKKDKGKARLSKEQALKVKGRYGDRLGYSVKQIVDVGLKNGVFTRYQCERHITKTINEFFGLMQEELLKGNILKIYGFGYIYLKGYHKKPKRHYSAGEIYYTHDEKYTIRGFMSLTDTFKKKAVGKVSNLM